MQSINNIKICEKKDFIIEGIMKSKGLYCLIAFPKVGKSMLALQIADGEDCKLFGHSLHVVVVFYGFKCVVDFVFHMRTRNIVYIYLF